MFPIYVVRDSESISTILLRKVYLPETTFQYGEERGTWSPSGGVCPVNRSFAKNSGFPNGYRPLKNLAFTGVPGLGPGDMC